MQKHPKHLNIEDVVSGLRQRDSSHQDLEGFILAMALGALFANRELDKPDARISAMVNHLLRQAAQMEKKGRASLRLVKKPTKE